VLVYTVTLSNPTSAAISLTPCPSYTQTLFSAVASSRRIQQTLLLNCSAATSIPSKGTLTYEMRLAIPGDLPSGPGKLTWTLDVPNAFVDVGTAIQVK